MRQRICCFLGSVLLVFTFLFIVLLPHTAFAAPAHPKTASQHHVTQQADSGSTVTYHNGPLMTGAISVYTIFWQPTGSTVDPQYSTLLNRFFNDYNRLSLSNVLKQYPDSTGATATSVSLGGTWTDTQAFPSSPLSLTQAEQEITTAMQVNGWTSSFQHVFFLYPVAGEEICNSPSDCSPHFCGEHTSFGTNTMSAFVPDDASSCNESGINPNNDPQADSAINITSHELAESITDPTSAGWFSGSTAGEIGDLCAFIFGPGQSAFNGGDIAAGSDFYMLEELWSNVYNVCALDYSTVAPTGLITSPTNGYAYSLHSNLVIAVTANSSDATITMVKFFADNAFLGEVTTAPFTLDEGGSLSVGTYTLTALVQDSRYSTVTTAGVQITIDPQSCKVTYQISSQQSNTFSASVTITNTGQGNIVNWALDFAFPGNQQITQLWNANFSQNGNQVHAFNPSYSPIIPPNGQASFGFNASFSGTNTNPTSFLLNSTGTCTVG